MAYVTLGAKAINSVVKLKESGALVEFYVINHNYESELNGPGRVLLLRKDCHSKQVWNKGTNAYAGSSIDNWLNGTYKNLLDADIRAAMGTTKFYYTLGNGSKEKAVLERAVFLVSGTECGIVHIYINNEGELQVRGDARTSHLNGQAVTYATRSPTTNGTQQIWTMDPNNTANFASPSELCGARPAFTLPTTLLVSDDGTVTANTAPTTPGSITVPESIQGGSSATVSWTASTDEQGNLEGYILERSVDGGGSWAQVYQGSALSTANTVAFGTQSVMYRVKAYDSEGLSSGWRTSAAVMVVNNVAPGAPAVITVPETVLGGQPLTVSWGAATDSDGNLDQYHLERRVNGGDWTEIYSGAGQSFTDSITKGWQTVAYRVRAADALGVFGDYTASPVREVDNNTAPVISCEQAGDLGEKGAGFTVSYTVSDEENDMVTVTEFVDGAVKRTFQAGTGANSFAVTGEDFMKLLNGPHAMLISASDGKITATHELTFTKLVTSASVTLAEPMGASEAITLCALSVSGGIPADAEFKVEVTNNANDASPAWEDCTTAVRNRLNHIFENKTAANGFAFNFRLHVERGESGQGGYITSIQGGFQ